VTLLSGSGRIGEMPLAKSRIFRQFANKKDLTHYFFNKLQMVLALHYWAA
jgi:hypothetical protein